MPTPNVSLVDLTFIAENAPESVEAINQILREGALSGASHRIAGCTLPRCGAGAG